MRKHDRFPRIEDEKKPWTYRGWLMAYRMLAEDMRIGMPAIPRVWTYWMDTMLAGKLLDAPIPRQEYGSDYTRGPGFKIVEKSIDFLSHSFGVHSALDSFLDWLLWGFGQTTEPPKLGDREMEWLYRNFDFKPWLREPSDYIGEFLAQWGIYNRSGFFPTPHNICEMMTRMNFGDAGDMRSKTVCDPAVGTGRMLLHAGNHSLRLYGMDINYQVLKILKINGYMYCPWMVRAFPEHFFEKETNDAPGERKAVERVRHAPVARMARKDKRRGNRKATASHGARHKNSHNRAAPG